MRTLIKYHHCTRHQNPWLRLRGWHCWRCRRAFGGSNEWRACTQCSADVDTCDCPRATWFARLRARTFGHSQSVVSGRTDAEASA